MLGPREDVDGLPALSACPDQGVIGFVREHFRAGGFVLGWRCHGGRAVGSVVGLFVVDAVGE